MGESLRFILNDEEISTNASAGMVVLDFIRRQQRLMGTKIGCREGDCGACTVLVGSLTAEGMVYRSMTSCLMPLANAHGKHLVTVEGLNRDQLTPYQQAIVDEGGTQCGFCTVGFVVSLAGWCMSQLAPTQEEALAAMDGNICRCTGYKSLERAAARICDGLQDKPHKEPLAWLVEKGYLPDYFEGIPQRLAAVQTDHPAVVEGAVITGGGTDLYVQRPEEMSHSAIRPLFGAAHLEGIGEQDGQIVLGASTTVEDIKRSPLMQGLFPNLEAQLKWVSSTPIRNMATIAGNFVNASPIGDMTIFFLALDATLHLDDGKKKRTLPLPSFYKDYKDINLREGEWISAISFPKPTKGFAFNFEKVSKREHLDIASVNAAAGLHVDNDIIQIAHLSAGGVSPVPLYLANTSSWLVGRTINEETVAQAAVKACEEISPISDARGTSAYKTLLLRQLIYAHFINLFPEAVSLEALV